MFVVSCVIIFFIECSVATGSSIEQMTMHNKHFKIGAMPTPPTTFISKDQNGEYIIGGLLGKLFEYMNNARNCTFKVVMPDDGTWGNCYGKNNCTGMIGMVNRKEVDFALGSKNHSKQISFENVK